jgi:hypothetical protein
VFLLKIVLYELQYFEKLTHGERDQIFSFNKETECHVIIIITTM